MNITRAAGILIVGTLMFCGCNETPLNNGLDVFFPVITLYKPAHNDAVPVGRHEIIYGVNDPKGITRYELVVNDSVVNVVNTTSNGGRPAIFWDVPSTALGFAGRVLPPCVRFRRQHRQKRGHDKHPRR